MAEASGLTSRRLRLAPAVAVAVIALCVLSCAGSALAAETKQSLLARLGSADLASWPAAIDGLDALGADDVSEFLLAPAVVPDTPPEIRDRALAALRRVHERCAEPGEPWQPPTRGEAVARITHRLDRVLWAPTSPDVEHDRARGDAVRMREALHLARDLMALGATDPETVRLVLLARLEALRGPTPGTVPPDFEPGQLAAVLTGPDGLDIEAVADVLDLAASRGLFTAAAAAARGLEEAALPPDHPLDTPAAPLPPAVRQALVRALAVPDAELQFAAARTLALAASPPPWPGSSRVVATLVHAATATGSDRVVVAHHDADIAHEIAAGVSRFGYRPTVVSTGRAAVLAARDHADTVLVILGARIVKPSAFETVQFIQEQPHGDIPPVLVVVDPFDDLPRGPFLTKSILKFSRIPCVALVDRMESFFIPSIDANTGAELAPARFPQTLEDVAGPAAASADGRTARAAHRLDRGRQAATLLAILHRRDWDIPADVRGRLGLVAARRRPAGYNQPAFTPPPPAPADAALSEPTR
ncbi:MAG: hypothetical protein WCR51_06085 [Planctomycetia bacterium]